MLIDPVRELKVRAEMLQRRARAGEPDAIARLRVLPELKPKDDAAVLTIAREIQRKHCLAAVARELGFTSFMHAKRVLEGDARETNFGKMLYGDWGARLNHWFAAYEEAREFLESAHTAATSREDQKYLLAYQKHFFIVDRYFIEALGLDPDDADWEAMGWNWVKPKSREARTRLYAKLLGARRN
jgi:hypothetical protein